MWLLFESELVAASLLFRIVDLGLKRTRVTLIENFASNAAVQKLVDVKPDRTSPEIL